MYTTALPESFYDRSPDVVAPELLGMVLVRRLQSGAYLAGSITETEAYLPFEDPASHGTKRRSKAKQSLYLRAGHAYVYGMRHHFLLNAVTENEDRPGSVLIRSVLPLEGVEEMMRNRDRFKLKGLTDGPAKVCQAFAVNKALDGADLTASESPLYIAYGSRKADADTIKISPRIGVGQAKEALLRFYL